MRLLIPLTHGDAMNVLNAVARLTTDPEAGETNGGTPTSKMRLAIPRRKAKDGAERPPVFVDMQAYGTLAELCNTHLGKGRQVGVVARLEHDEWQTDAGEPRSKHYLVAIDVDFLARPNGTSSPPAEERAAGPEKGS